jgi:hypothetical protein
VQGSGSRPESARGVCGSSLQNRRVTWLRHKTKTGGSTGGDGIWARHEASMSMDMWRNRRACVKRTRTMAKAWPCDEEECYMTYLPLRDLYHNLSARGSLVICPTQRDSYILTLGFLGKLSFRLLLISLLHRRRFSSPFCREFVLRMYGSFHGCVDFLLVALVILVSF